MPPTCWPAPERCSPTHPVIDGHNDLPWALREQVRYRPRPAGHREDQSTLLHTDLPRLRAGGVGGSSGRCSCRRSLQGDSAVTATLEQVDCVVALADRYPDGCASPTTATTCGPRGRTAGSRR